MQSSHWLEIARLGLAGNALPDAMLWDELDLNDPEDRRFGDFELLERIGRGGMGVVFRARQMSLGREVAVKFIVGSLADNPRAIATFFAEARAAARLHHPHIVPVFEIGKADGMHFFSMPLLASLSLAQRLASGKLGKQESIELLLKLCAAVEYAHGFGLLHLDLKPANVLFDDRGQPLIGDFGLARQVDADGGVDAHEVSGTAAYMAPEQTDIGRQRLSPRTDIYALGAILYEFLTGRAPHGDGDADAQMQAAWSGRVVSPRRFDATIDKDIDAICMKCLQVDPAHRYPSIAALAADLSRYRDGNTVNVRQPSWRERSVRAVRRNTGIALATAIAFAVMAIGLLTTGWQWQRAESEAARARDLAGFMAAAFSVGDALRDGRSSSARDAVAWLKLHAPDDPATQRGVLASFRQALVATNKGEAVTALMNEIIDQLGDGYRQEQVTRLSAKGDRDGLVSAVIIGIPRGDQTSGDIHDQAMQQLFERYPNDSLALYAAAIACHAQRRPCPHPEYYEGLVSKFPDNAANWVLVPSGAKLSELALADQVMHASGAREFNDQIPALFTLLGSALRDQPLPQSILQPMQAVVDASEVAPSLRRNAIGQVALPFYGGWSRTCKLDSAMMTHVPGLQAACVKVATNAMRSPQASILAKMIGSAILRRLCKGTALEAEAKEYRRQYVWLDQYVCTDVGKACADSEGMQQDIANYGEWEAWQRQAERAGASRTPPADWLPKNQQTMLLSEDRTASPVKP